MSGCSNRRTGRAVAIALTLLATMTACSNGEDGLAGNPAAPGRSTPTPDASTSPAGSATPTPSPSPVPPTLAIVPSTFTLSSDPAASPGVRALLVSLVELVSDRLPRPATGSWTVAPPGLVTVDSRGYVSAIANAPAGLVTLSASSGSLVATAVIQVVAKPVTVNDVVLSATALDLYAPASDGVNTAGLPTTATLVPTVTMSNGSTSEAVTWSSSNPSVATIDQAGKVTAVSAGQATLTAQASQDTSRQATCLVTVTAEGAVSVTVK